MTGKETPLGVMPEFLWRQIRVDDLLGAIARFAVAGRIGEPCVRVWVVELNNHFERETARLAERREQEP